MPSGPAGSGRGKSKELDRDIQPGEPVRVGVMISMPHQATISFEGDGDEAIGWEPGMELGIWEGVVSGADDTPVSDRSLGTEEIRGRSRWS